MSKSYVLDRNTVYSHTNLSGNIIKHNLRTHFFIKIYIPHTLLSKGLMFLWCVRDGWRDTYSERGLLPISSSRSQWVPTLAPLCKLVWDASGWLHVLRSTAILCTLSKSHRVVLSTWSPSGYTPVRPECPDFAILFTNQNVTACQTHGLTWNEPKLHGICYITIPDILKTVCKQLNRINYMKNMSKCTMNDILWKPVQ